MAYHWAVFKQETMIEEHVHTQISVYESEHEAYDQADLLNDNNTFIEDYYYVRQVSDPNETLEEVDNLLF
jgi:hypothetical protein